MKQFKDYFSNLHINPSNIYWLFYSEWNVRLSLLFCVISIFQIISIFIFFIKIENSVIALFVRAIKSIRWMRYLFPYCSSAWEPIPLFFGLTWLFLYPSAPAWGSTLTLRRLSKGTLRSLCVLLTFTVR